MRIGLPGGTAGRGGPCVLVEAEGIRVLVDPGSRSLTRESLAALAVAEAPLAVVITHAHADHAGALPLVVSAWPDVPILATPPTLALLRVLLSVESAGLLGRARPVPFYETYPLAEGGAWAITLTPAGHVLGAAMVHLQTPDGSVVCAGDVSLEPQHTVGRAARPRRGTDVLLLESTYGDRDFRPRALEEARLLTQVIDGVGRGGHVLIAVPALGTAQEILLVLAQATIRGTLPAPIWTDGLVPAVNAVYGEYARGAYPRLARFISAHGDPFRGGGPLIHAVTTEYERAALLAGPPAVFISTPPTLDGGPGATYAAKLAGGPDHTILLPAAQGDVAKLPGVARMGGARCRVGRYGLTLHADGAALAALAARWRPHVVVPIHGTSEARNALAARLAALGLRTALPDPSGQIEWP